MTSQQLLEEFNKTEVRKIGKAPVVVLPLKIWEALEDYLEDMQIANSRSLMRRIAKARSEKKLYSASCVRKMANT